MTKHLSAANNNIGTLPLLFISYIRLLLLALPLQPLTFFTIGIWCPVVGPVVFVTFAVSAPPLTGGTCIAL